MENEPRPPLSRVGKVVVSLFALQFSGMAIAGVFLAEPAMVAVGVLAVFGLLWPRRVFDRLRERTTARLSRSQLLAITLVTSTPYIAARAFARSEFPKFESVWLLGLIVWFGWSLRRHGWSKR